MDFASTSTPTQRCSSCWPIPVPKKEPKRKSNKAPNRESRPDTLPEWKALTRLAADPVGQALTEWLQRDNRFEDFSLQLPALLMDYSKQRVDARILNALLDLARARSMEANIEALFGGAPVNVTEHRAALHTALRSPAGQQPGEARSVVEPTLVRLASIAERVRSGKHRGYTGRAVTDIVHIGIGGSHLGPELVVEALIPIHGSDPRCHFLANIDDAALHSALTGLDPETTLFIVVSKSFGTLETRTNAESARSWFLERTGDVAAIARHFLAVTANVEAARAFGIPEENVYPLWDWVGGRFSLWSAVGLPIQLAVGPEAFAELLRGAHQMDEHFRTAPLERNGPLIMALLSVWNSNFLGATSHAVLPYSRRLRLLPDYLQQLEMESNGKSVHLDGSAVRIHTMPVLWGGEGTNGQHAFHQLLHQGTRAFSADFIVCASDEAATPQSLEAHHRWLLANAFAQSQAMMSGRQEADPHRCVAGNKATSTLVMDELSPFAIGSLLALYEHKVFCQGVIWNINSFDQWGVELGKQLALPIFDQLDGKPARQQDASTRGLVEYVRRRLQERRNQEDKHV